MDNEFLFSTNTVCNDFLYRNVVKPPVNPFDDLSEDEDDWDIANLFVVTSENQYTNAIGRSFEYSSPYPSRYGDGSYHVWYGSKVDITTLYETAFWMMKKESATNNQTQPVVNYRTVFKVHCNALLVDLCPHLEEASYLVSNDYSMTQTIGKKIYQQGIPGLMAPSARHAKKGINAAIFRKSALSNPSEYATLKYHFDPVSLLIKTSSEMDSLNLTINCSIWSK